MSDKEWNMSRMGMPNIGRMRPKPSLPRAPKLSSSASGANLRRDAKVRGPEIEPAEELTTPSIKKSAGFKGVMGRLKRGF